jgi:hypothetical protein
MCLPFNVGGRQRGWLHASTPRNYYRPDLSQVPCGLIGAWPKLFGDGAAAMPELMCLKAEEPIAN